MDILLHSVHFLRKLGIFCRLSGTVGQARPSEAEALGPFPVAYLQNVTLFA